MNDSNAGYVNKQDVFFMAQPYLNQKGTGKINVIDTRQESNFKKVTEEMQ